MGERVCAAITSQSSRLGNNASCICTTLELAFRSMKPLPAGIYAATGTKSRSGEESRETTFERVANILSKSRSNVCRWAGYKS